MTAVLHRYPRAGSPRLVLIHGWGFDARAWKPLIERLAPRYDLTCVDLPGFGGAPEGAQTDLVLIADRIAELVNQPALWLGWSLGGLVAVAAAARHPERVRAVLTLGTNPCFVERDDWPGMAKATFESFMEGVDKAPDKTLARFLMLQGQGDEVGRQVVRALRPSLAVESSPLTLRSSLALLQQDSRSLFKNLKVPALHLFGAEDALVPAAVAQMPLLAAHARVLPGRGHGLPHSAPDAIAKALEELSTAEGGA